MVPHFIIVDAETTLLPPWCRVEETALKSPSAEPAYRCTTSLNMVEWSLYKKSMISKSSLELTARLHLQTLFPVESFHCNEYLYDQHLNIKQL